MSREIHLATVPDGLPRPEHFALVDRPMPVAGHGEVLVRNRFFQVSARLRTLLSNTIADTPLPSVRPGESIPSATIGEIVTAPGGSGLSAGDLVFHWSGWREYSAVPATAVTPVDDTLPDPVAHLGSGWTAYAALTWYGKLRPGETVLITAGAGGVGSLAGQFARRLGAGRVIGTTGSPAKAERMRAEFGYDTVLPRDETIAADVIVDNVGGDQLTAAIAAARPGARIVLVGALAGQLSPDGHGKTAPVEVDNYQLILKDISINGFADPGDPEARTQWLRRFGAWLRSGEVTFPHVRVAGIERAPEALQEVIAGRHAGTVVVQVEEADEDR
jgi:NADPH-dependent curcumin reductase CurA